MRDIERLKSPMCDDFKSENPNPFDKRLIVCVYMIVCNSKQQVKARYAGLQSITRTAQREVKEFNQKTTSNRSL
jgi:hypothetical protein